MRGINLGLIVLLISSIGSYGQSKVERIEELVSKFSEYGDFNGAVLVAEKGRVIYKKGFGLANMEWDIPNQPSTKFRIASITKMFTNVLIVQLAEQGKLDLRASISTYLLDYPQPQADFVTVDHLRKHTSGIFSFTSAGAGNLNGFSREEILALFVDSTLAFTPGEQYQYSNSGYWLLGLIIEKVTGKAYEQVLQDQILTPLKMADSGYDRNRKILKNRAAGYVRKRNHLSFVNPSISDMNIPFSAGALYSTVEDMFKFDQGLYGQRLLSNAWMDTLYHPNDHFWSMRIGNTTDTVMIDGHEGGITGFNSLITRVQSNQATVVILNNTSGAPLRKMTRAVLGILNGKPYDLPKKSIANSLFDVVDKKGVGAGIEHFDTIKSLSHYELVEEDMNTVGYWFFQSDKLPEAEYIFKLNVASFPEAWNVHDSYGEILVALGKNKEAITSYQKSLELNPENEYGIEALKKLGAIEN